MITHAAAYTQVRECLAAELLKIPYHTHGECLSIQVLFGQACYRRGASAVWSPGGNNATRENELLQDIKLMPEDLGQVSGEFQSCRCFIAIQTVTKVEELLEFFL
jgi:hypothetical protein